MSDVAIRMSSSSTGAAKSPRAKAAISQRERLIPFVVAGSVPARQTGMALHTVEGARKYLTAGERADFLRAAERADRQVRGGIAHVLRSGCRWKDAPAACPPVVDRGNIREGL